ncbi:MAG TPA: ParB/RepB/Spo0J family partition protein [Candidatus Acidoferrum sp.]|jgi:ParB family chromosome partitioning protein|nr:ParB/RepB/Spo0J family partition protein [Candidatus Acidoferrum sp.]
MTTAAEKVAVQPAEKKEEKVEKRRALGRGLESLLPGPRVVTPSGAGGPVQDGGEGGEKQVPHFVRNDMASIEQQAAGEMDAKRAGAPAPHEQLPHPTAARAAGQPGAAVPTFAPPTADEYQPGEVISIQAVADDRIVGNRVVHLPIELILKNPYQPRRAFDEKALEELRDSIQEHGVVQPVVVRPAEEEGRYILVLGERRLRASRMAGKDTIPALVRRLSPQQAAEMTVLENVVREDLNPMEQAHAFKILSQEFKLTQVQIAQRIGVARETVANYMRLLRLPGEVMDYVARGELSFSEARELLALENPEHILQLAEEVLVTHPTAEQIAERVRRLNDFPVIPGAAVAKQGTARWVDPNVRAAQLDLERTLGMRVKIKDHNGKGKIVIEYASVDDYERVTTLLRSKK